jgi:hypothetical protein
MMSFTIFEFDDQSLTTLAIAIAALLGMFQIDCDFLSAHTAASKEKTGRPSSKSAILRKAASASFSLCFRDRFTLLRYNLATVEWLARSPREYPWYLAGKATIPIRLLLAQGHTSGAFTASAGVFDTINILAMVGQLSILQDISHTS